MMTRRQAENAIAAAAGLSVGEAWQPAVDAGDTIALLIVERGGLPRSVCGLTLAVEDHGHYRRARVRAGGEVVEVELPQTAPPEWGCVECRVVTRAKWGATRARLLPDWGAWKDASPTRGELDI